MLVPVFFVMIFVAFQDLKEARTGYSHNVKELPLQFPSLTICPQSIDWNVTAAFDIFKKGSELPMDIAIGMTFYQNLYYSFNNREHLKEKFNTTWEETWSIHCIEKCKSFCLVFNPPKTLEVKPAPAQVLCQITHCRIPMTSIQYSPVT